MAEEAPKIHVDTDWKAQAQAEKQKLAEQAEQVKTEGGTRPGEMPPASIETLVSTIATQALFALGAIPDPATGQRYQSLDLARHHIDMLSVLNDKTQGNLTEEEAEVLKQSLYELRQAYIKIAGTART